MDEFLSLTHYDSCDFSGATRFADDAPNPSGVYIQVDASQGTHDRYFACYKICSRFGHKVKICAGSSCTGCTTQRTFDFRREEPRQSVAMTTTSIYVAPETTTERTTTIAVTETYTTTAIRTTTVPTTITSHLSSSTTSMSTSASLLVASPSSTASAIVSSGSVSSQEVHIYSTQSSTLASQTSLPTVPDTATSKSQSRQPLISQRRSVSAGTSSPSSGCTSRFFAMMSLLALIHLIFLI